MNSSSKFFGGRNTSQCNVKIDYYLHCIWRVEAFHHYLNEKETFSKLDLSPGIVRESWINISAGTGLKLFLCLVNQQNLIEPFKSQLESFAGIVPKMYKKVTFSQVIH